jgi:hypothetical protein
VGHENIIFLSTTVKLTEVNVKDLQTGMYVSKLDRPWLDSSFMFQGFELKTKTKDYYPTFRMAKEKIIINGIISQSGV